MKKLLYISSILLFLFSACRFTVSEEISPKNRVKVVTMTEKFYKCLATDDYPCINSLFGDSKNFTKKEMDSMLHLVVTTQISRFGKIDSHVLKAIKTNVGGDENYTGTYNMFFETIRNGKKFTETFSVRSEGTDFKVNEYLVTPIQE